MSLIRNCGKDEINNNVEPAKATNHKYGAVEIVLTERVQVQGGPWQIKFWVYGDASERIHQAEWGNTDQMWAACPSTLPSEAMPDAWGEPPREQTRGMLYFSESFLADHQLIAEPKWPPLLPTTVLPSEVLEIFPLKLELTGVELRSGRFRKATVNLLDSSLASPKQKIELDGSSPVKVRLTQAGFAHPFHLPFRPSKKTISEALAVVSSSQEKSPAEIAGAASVIAAAMAYVSSGERLEAELSKDVREQFNRLFSIAE